MTVTRNGFVDASVRKHSPNEQQPRATHVTDNTDIRRSFDAQPARINLSLPLDVRRPIGSLNTLPDNALT